MKNKNTLIGKTNVLPWVSVLTAISALAVSLCTIRFQDFNSVITVLGILISILIGWQIYAVVETEKRLAKISKDIVKEAERRVEERNTELWKRESKLYVALTRIFANSRDWKGVVVAGTTAFTLLDRLDGVGDQYEILCEAVEGAYIADKSTIEEMDSEDLIKAIEDNLENSSRVRELWLVVTNRSIL